MALKDAFKRLTTSTAELDHERLRQFCAERPGVTPIAQLVPRKEATVIGEITSVRIVPQREGSPWLEATVSDTTGSLVALWTGRRKIAGVVGGRRLMLSGRSAPSGPGGRPLIYNPVYELF